MALASLIAAKGAHLEGASILMYSYGSGLAAGMFVLKGRPCAGKFSLQNMQSKVRSEQSCCMQLMLHTELCHLFLTVSMMSNDRQCNSVACACEVQGLS